MYFWCMNWMYTCKSDFGFKCALAMRRPVLLKSTGVCERVALCRNSRSGAEIRLLSRTQSLWMCTETKLTLL